MSLLTIRDGETYCHLELQSSFGFKSERSFKEFLSDLEVPFFVIQGRWWVAGEDVRKALRLQAVTQSQRREDKAEA